MKTFEVYGDVYPEDSKYARLMAQYMMPPTYGRDAKVEWELYRDFALKKRMSEKDMKAFMVAKDSAHHNMILGRPPRTERDMNELYARQFRMASSRIAEDECSSITDTMDYVRCRAKKMEKEQGTPADKAFPTAWSIACKYKRDQLDDADEHCKQKPSGYFKSKKALDGDSMNRKANRGLLQLMIETILPALYRWRSPMLSSSLKNDLKDLATDRQMEEVVVSNNYEELMDLMHNKKAMDWIQIDPQTYKKALMAMLINARKMRLATEEVVAGHTPESFKKMLKENPELAEEWEKQIEENRGVVSSLLSKWADVSDLFSKPHESVYGKVSEDDTEIMAKFEKGVSADPTENMSPEDKKKWEAMKDKHSDKFKQSSDKTARLDKRQIGVLETYAMYRSSTALYFKSLPPKIQDSLKRIKDQPSLERDVDNWLYNYRREQEIRQNRWATNNFNRSAKENPMNKTARVALRNLTANWGLTAEEAYEMLAEEELAEYLAEQEAEMFAEEMEAGGNSGFDRYKEMGKPGAFKPNYTNEDRGGKGRGGKGNKNYLYYDYGSADSYSSDYQKRYYQKRKNKEDIDRKTCPDMKGGKMPCKDTKK